MCDVVYVLLIGPNPDPEWQAAFDASLVEAVKPVDIKRDRLHRALGVA